MVKRILAIVLVLVFLFAFTACEKEKKEDISLDVRHYYFREVGRGLADCTRTKNYYVYVSLIPRVKDESSVEIEIPYPDNSYRVTQTGKIYDSFVAYEDISIVGHFVGYGEMAYNDQVFFGDLYIAYILQDNLFSKVELHIVHTGQEGLGEEEPTIYGLPRLDPSCVVPNSKMRTLLEGYAGGFVDVGDVRYIYTHGKLKGIKWAHAGFEFILREFEDYPSDCTYTFIGKLLDPMLAHDAVTLFNQQLDARRGARQ